jgi:hypothetical protein
MPAREVGLEPKILERKLPLEAPIVLPKLWSALTAAACDGCAGSGR